MTNARTAPGNAAPASKGLEVALWIVQSLLCITFAGTGIWKLVTPVDVLAAMIPWAGQVPRAFLHATAVFDLLGGAGVLLPSVTRIEPGLAVLAALGCAALQLCAILFHLSRGELAGLPFNLLLVVLALFVYWGRRTKAPISPRG